MTCNSATGCLVVLLQFLLLCTEPVSAARQVEKCNSGTVEFLVLDTYGNPLRSFDLVVSGADAEGLSRKVRPNAKPVTLPYGSYVVSGRASLHHPIERGFVLKEPRLLVTVALSFHDPGESQWQYGPPLKVRVRNLPAERGRLWIRLVSLLGVFVKEAVLERSGEVSIYEVPYGDYVVLVFQDSQLLETVQFRRTLREEECSINLRVARGGNPGRYTQSPPSPK
jgi:hypothetical protein